MSTSTLNGRPQRKQLADQIDRLDGIIDALAEGLNAAVAEACREGTRLAVKDAVVELLTNPELRALFAAHIPAPAPTPAPAPEPKGPGLWARIKAKVAAARASAARAINGVVTRAKEALIRRCVIAGDAVVALGRTTGEPLPVRRVLLTGLGIGLVVAAACLILPQTTAAVVSGIGATGTAVGVQVGRWLTRTARRVGLLN